MKSLLNINQISVYKNKYEDAKAKVEGIFFIQGLENLMTFSKNGSCQ